MNLNEKYSKDLALYILDLLPAQIMKENKMSSYQDLASKLSCIQTEREEVYKGNEETVKKIINNYKQQLNS